MTSDADSKRDSTGIKHKRFATTSWTLVVDAAGDSQEKQRALSQLCESYWYPLYAYARKRGNGAADSEDLTQAFFAELLSQNRLAAADQSRGRFRTFLLTSMDNFLKNDWRTKQTLKRGGGKQTLSLDFEAAENRFQNEPSTSATADRTFERSWAIEVLNRALASVEQQYKGSGKEQLFETLKSNITGDSSLAYEEVAEQLNMKTGAVKVAVHRLRERYSHQLRLQIAQTVESPEQVDEELQSLFKALSSY